MTNKELIKVCKMHDCDAFENEAGDVTMVIRFFHPADYVEHVRVGTLAECLRQLGY